MHKLCPGLTSGLCTWERKSLSAQPCRERRNLAELDGVQNGLIKRASPPAAAHNSRCVLLKHRAFLGQRCPHAALTLCHRNGLIGSAAFEAT